MTPNPHRNQLDGGEEIERVFVVSGGNPPELLDLVEEPFDQIALAIDPGRKGETAFAVRAGRNVGSGFPVGGQGTNGVAVNS